MLLLLWFGDRLYFFGGLFGLAVVVMFGLLFINALLDVVTISCWGIAVVVTIDAAFGGMATSVIISVKSSVIQNCWTSDAIRLIFSKSSVNDESNVKNMSSTITPFSVPSDWLDVGSEEFVDCTPEWFSSNSVVFSVESANVNVVYKINYSISIFDILLAKHTFFFFSCSLLSVLMVIFIN